MLRREEEIRAPAVWAAAQEVLLAIRTAPKTRGLDKLEMCLASGDEQAILAAKMDEVNERSGGARPTFSRDAKGVLAASAILVVAAAPTPYGLNCGWCGFPTCGEKPPAVPCAFGAIDLGIGAGVAAAKLAGKHIDNRMMFSMGVAALELGWFSADATLALGFPLSVSGKNPYFDRG
ncbi:MAG: DUF2148 domain-containing protein [Planctomycetes bacterium]|nr:DUF2148 domain-containing protein [Planctomycetota bacterium]